jgi:sigma-B regulation protein RsbU (phosphoserine phosphatase)
MGETPARSKTPQGSFPELLDGLRLLEGRMPANELAQRVVNAAMLLPEIAGARLWRVDNGTAIVWTAGGVLPPSGDNHTVAGAVINPTNDGTLWAVALGSDDFRVRVLEVRGKSDLSSEVRAQLDFLARFASVVLALAERRGAMEELSSIIEATKKLNSTLDLGELIHIILQIAIRQTGADRGTVFLVDREREEIWSLVGLGLQQQVIRLPVTRGIAGWVAREGTAVRLDNAYDDARFEPDIDKRLGFTTRQLLCLPIRNEAGAIIGVLQLLNKGESFTDDDEAFIDALSAHVALALEKAQLHRERLQKEKLERDLELAREIQAGFLPEKPPEFPGVEIVVSHRASQMVGGDYYDFLPVQSEGRHALLIVVADVEGKGAASALVMANVQAILHALADRVEPLEKLPETINQKILASGRGARAAGRATKYLSMFLAVIEENGRKVRYVNAGHVPPVVIRADGRQEWLEAGGMIVGLLPGVEYESGVIELGPGDLMVACTDGITEAMDSEGNEYGRPRLAETVARESALSAEGVMRKVLGEVEVHARNGMYEDDRILLVMKVL